MKLKRVLKGYVELWLIGYYIEFNMSARWKMSHFKIHRPSYNNRKNGFYRHIVWGKFSLVISQPQLETVRMCSECNGDEPIESKGYGDEIWDICPNCNTVEGNTHEISEWDFENGLK